MSTGFDDVSSDSVEAVICNVFVGGLLGALERK
jgi:hypothetical protein